MKKLLVIVFIAVSMLSCRIYKTPYTTSSYAIDYTVYAENGLYLTESPCVSFKYEPVGHVQARVSSGYEVKEIIARPMGDQEVVYGKFKTANIYEALDELFFKCREMGANGVINLKVEYGRIPIEEFNVTFKEKKKLGNALRITVSGMAIKY